MPRSYGGPTDINFKCSDPTDTSGKKYTFSKETSVEQIKSVFGFPQQEWDDDAAYCLEYKIYEFELECIWDIGHHKSLRYLALHLYESSKS